MLCFNPPSFNDYAPRLKDPPPQVRVTRSRSASRFDVGQSASFSPPSAFEDLDDGAVPGPGHGHGGAAQPSARDKTGRRGAMGPPKRRPRVSAMTNTTERKRNLDEHLSKTLKEREAFQKQQKKSEVQEKSKGNHGGLFTRVTVTGPPEQPPASALSEALQQRSANKGGRGGRSNMVTKRCFLAFSSTPLEPLTIQVYQSHTVRDMIAAALRQHREENGGQLKYDTPDAYTIFAAEPDGSPEEDVPQLDKSSYIIRIGFSFFIIKEDPSYRPPQDTSSSSSSSSQQQQQQHHLHQQKVITGNTVQTEAEKNIEDVRIPLIMDNNRKGIQVIAPDMQLKELKSLVTSSQNLDPDKYKIQVVVEDGTQMDIPKKYMDRIIKSVPQIKKLVLINLDKGNDDKPEMIEGNFFFTDMTAIQYKEYEVIKINRYGQRQNRVLGIDRENLHNMMPESGGFSLWTRGRTRHPLRAIKDIIAINFTNEDKPRNFTIQFVGETGTEKLHYEAKTVLEAKEIVGKIRHLVAMHKKAKQPEHDPRHAGASASGVNANTSPKPNPRVSRRMSVKLFNATRNLVDGN